MADHSELSSGPTPRACSACCCFNALFYPGPRRFPSGPFDPSLSMHTSIANKRFMPLQSRPLLTCAAKTAKKVWTQTKKEHSSFRHPNRPSPSFQTHFHAIRGLWIRLDRRCCVPFKRLVSNPYVSVLPFGEFENYGGGSPRW